MAIPAKVAVATVRLFALSTGLLLSIPLSAWLWSYRRNALLVHRCGWNSRDLHGRLALHHKQTAVNVLDHRE